jgi:hypothetical protein
MWLPWVAHVLADRSGEWHVSILGTQRNDRWEMKIYGPNGFEGSNTLEGVAGQHEPGVIAAIVLKMATAGQHMDRVQCAPLQGGLRQEKKRVRGSIP